MEPVVVDTVTVDLAGMGARSSDVGPFTLERFADDVADAVDAVDGPVVLVGQSMGTQIAELVAVRRPECIRGLVLITPIPLAGTHLPAEFAASMKALTQAPVEEQRAARLAFAPRFPPGELDRLITIGASVPATTVSDALDAWDRGVPAGREPSQFTGPVLLLPGELDQFATPEVLAAGVIPRFADVEVTRYQRPVTGLSRRLATA